LATPGPFAIQARQNGKSLPAADGTEAIQRAEELKPDLILLDIGLPK
jgi:CheY-like chemotaxis protein